MSYWYDRQPDLFFVAEVDGRVVGGIVSGIKPWFDGNRLVDGELFVDKKYQERHL
ncbi:GNAT family N-acetyltransferase [bacterium]|nr:GNAT family N-acetyltransferase [bacterium]